MLPYQAAGMKAALNLMGLKGTQPRRPMPPMPETEVERLRVLGMQLRALLATVGLNLWERDDLCTLNTPTRTALDAADLRALHGLHYV